jgi:hypothetical protein
MPNQLLYAFIDYGSVVLVVGAIVVGVVMTRGAVRKLLVAALVVTVVRFLLNYAIPTSIDVAKDVGVFAYGVVEWLLYVAQPLLLVAAAIVGATAIRAKDTAIAALVDQPTDTWR